MMREHRNSYITAVNSSKQEYRESTRFTGSLESIGGSSETATLELPSPTQPLDRAGSVDSVLTNTKVGEGNRDRYVFDSWRHFFQNL